MTQPANGTGNDRIGDNSGIRNVLRVAGVVLVLGGLVLAGLGFASFFSAFGGNGSPDHFWMAFLGLPMLSLGGWCLAAGFLGRIARYTADEGSPLFSRLGSAFGATRSPVAPPTGGRSGFCTRCGTPMTADAMFCGSCGARRP